MGKHDRGSFALEGRDAGQCFVKDHTKGIDIGLCGGAFAFAFDLFGRHVQRASKGFSCLRDGAFCGDARDAKVEELEDFFALGRSAMEKEIFGFEVAVDDLALMDVMKGGAELR